MKGFHWAIATLILLLAQCAYADSVLTFDITHAGIPIFPNNGGDNEFFTFTGPVASIFGGGTAVCAWCVEGTQFSPGSSLNPSVELVTFDFVQGTVRFGGQAHDVVVLFNSSIAALSSFSFPTNGKSAFIVTVPAILNGPIVGEAATGDSFNLQVPPGPLTLTFAFVPAQNGSPCLLPVYERELCPGDGTRAGRAWLDGDGLGWSYWGDSTETQLQTLSKLGHWPNDSC
jgi:hypothetical protein